MLFFREALRHLKTIGAVCPYSSGFARYLVKAVPLSLDDKVVEIGTGTGSITDALLERVPVQQFLGLDLNPHFVAHLVQRFPKAVIHCTSVMNLKTECKEMGWSNVDKIVCSIPWANFEEDMQKEILSTVSKCLSPRGELFAVLNRHSLWLPKGKSFSALLPQYFTNIETSKVYWWNLPPAFFYRCRNN